VSSIGGMDKRWKRGGASFQPKHESLCSIIWSGC
jgi:hypothetical protein